jgi:hypothetical protein
MTPFQPINRHLPKIMKTKFNIVRYIFATAALGVLASFAYAGPPPDFWNRARPITTTQEAATVKPDDTVMMVCGACKSVMIRDSKHFGPAGKGHDEWFVIGSKHKCDHCGGEITIVRGKTADSMQHNCSMCGEGAAFCCAAPAVADKK